MNIAAAGGGCDLLSTMLQQQQANDPIPIYVAQNPLYASMVPFLQSRRLIVDNGDVYAEEIQLKLNGLDYHVVAKCWPEHRCSSSHDQLLAAQRASHLLKGRSTAHELLTCRVQGQGNVAISRYAGSSLYDMYTSGCLRDTLTTTQKEEEFLQSLAADLLLGLCELEEPEVGISYRDLKPENMVCDALLGKWGLIDHGLATPFDGTQFVRGLSDGYFPVDLVATNPADGRPYFLSQAGERKRVAAVMQSRAGGLDSNVLGLVLVKIITSLHAIPWPAVSKNDDMYKLTAAEASAAGTDEQRLQLLQLRDMQFAQDYSSYMSDQQQQQDALAPIGLSAGAVRFLLSLLEVDPDQRPSIQEAIQDPWVLDAVVRAQAQRVALFDDEQVIAAHYAGFGAALEQANQECRDEQQRKEESAALVSQCLGDSQQVIAALQQQVKHLEQQNLMLHQQLATLAGPSPAAPDALLEKLATAEAEAANARQLCQHQAGVIKSLEGQVAVHQQYATQAFNAIAQLAQSRQQQQQQQVYCDPSSTTPAAATVAASSNLVRPMQPNVVSAVPPSADRPRSLQSLQWRDAGAQPLLQTEQDAVAGGERQKQHLLHGTQGAADASRCHHSSSNGNVTANSEVPNSHEVREVGQEQMGLHELLKQQLLSQRQQQEEKLAEAEQQNGREECCERPKQQHAPISDQQVQAAATTVALAAINSSSVSDRVTDKSNGTNHPRSDRGTSDLSTPNAPLCNAGGYCFNSSILATAALQPSMRVGGQAASSAARIVGRKSTVMAATKLASELGQIGEHYHSNSSGGVSGDGVLTSNQVDSSAGYNSSSSSQRRSGDGSVVIPSIPFMSLDNSNSSDPADSCCEVSGGGSRLSQLIAAARHTAVVTVAAGVERLSPDSNQNTSHYTDSIAEIPVPNDSGVAAAELDLLEGTVADDAEWIAAFTRHADHYQAGAAANGGLLGTVSAAVDVAAASVGFAKPYDLYMSFRGWMTWLNPVLSVVGGSFLEWCW